MVITMGAGNVYKIGEQIIEAIKKTGGFAGFYLYYSSSVGFSQLW